MVPFNSQTATWDRKVFATYNVEVLGPENWKNPVNIARTSLTLSSVMFVYHFNISTTTVPHMMCRYLETIKYENYLETILHVFEPRVSYAALFCEYLICFRRGVCSAATAMMKQVREWRIEASDILGD